MSEDNVRVYHDMARELLDDAGIPCTKWFNSLKSDHFPWPLLLFTARDRDFSAVTNERSRVKETSHYTNIMSNPVLEQRLMAQVRDQVHQRRVQRGVDYRSIARKLGHEEVQGKFAFEQKNNSLKFRLGSDCLFCGIHGHDIPQCPEFLREYQMTHGQPYQAEAPASTHGGFNNDQVFYNNLGANFDPNFAYNFQLPVPDNANFKAPGQHFIIQGSFHGYAILGGNGQLKIECNLTSGYSLIGFRKVDLTGGAFVAENGEFVKLEEMQCTRCHAMYQRGQEGGYGSHEQDDCEQGQAYDGRDQEGGYNAYGQGGYFEQGVQEDDYEDEYKEMGPENSTYSNGDEVGEMAMDEDEDAMIDPNLRFL